MTTATAILSHALKMVFHDFAGTLRATAAGLIVVAGAAVLLLSFAPNFADLMISGDEAAARKFTTDNLGLALLGILGFVIGYMLLVTSWHRYVLLPDDGHHSYTPGFGILLGYFGRSLLIGLITLIAAIPLGFIIGLVATLLNSVLLAQALSVLMMACLGWLALRISLILPACSIDKKLTIGESWAATDAVSFVILKLTIAIGAANVLIGFLQTALFGTTGIVAGSIGVAVSVLFTLISASVLTTLYGTLIEGREI